MRIITVLFTFLLLLSSPLFSADRGFKLTQMKEEQRIALVIGNNKFTTMAELKNPVPDAEAIRDALKKTGFDVHFYENIDLKAFKKAIQKFASQLSKGGVGLFYYAGHGIQVDGENYLLASNSDISAKDDVEFESIPLDYITSKMNGAHNRFNIIILDACRNDPFSRGASGGLAPVGNARGIFVAYATEAGSVAQDGSGKGHSPFTKHLIANIYKPVTIEKVFKLTREEVYADTDKAQFPGVYNQSMGEFYFTLPKNLGNQPETTESTDTVQNSKTEEDILWEGIRGTNHIDGYTYYLKEYPQGRYAALARFEIKMLKDKNAAEHLYTLSIAASPKDATVKILNIKPKYKDGMQLNEGSYHIEVTKEGYKSIDEWVQLDRDISKTITLQKIQSYKADLSKLLKQKPLAQTYYNQKKYKQAFEIYQPLAELDDTKAQNMLGIMYQNGYYVTKGVEKAAYWYRKAADNGYTWGQSNLAWMYNHGEGVAKDHKLAMYWYKKAAAQGNASAMNNIGWMYEKGWGVPKNRNTAIKWYEKAVQENSEKAKKNLARLKKEAASKPKEADLSKLLKQKPLAWTYYNQKEYKKAFEIYQPLAEHGDAFSQNMLGLMYFYGYYIKKSQEKAVYWYRKAADLGYAWGQSNLALMYLNGTGVATDYKLAMYWLKKAAAQGNSNAMNDIGTMYESGKGVTKNLDTAIKWYEKAVRENSGTGSEVAKKNLARLKKEAASNLNVSGTWHTNWKNMYLTQNGDKVSGKYDHHSGKIAGQLTNNTLEGYWYQPDSGKKCGPSNAWSGKFVFAFDKEGKSFKGDWSYCDKSISSLNPSKAKWNGKR